MSMIKRFANMLSEYSAFYIMEAGYAAVAIDSLCHNRYYEAAKIIAVGAVCTAFVSLAKKVEKNLENRL